jgi:hypothetical protein
LSVQNFATQGDALTGSSIGFSNQLQTFASGANNELFDSKTRFELSTASSGVLPQTINDFLIINECNKAFSSKFSSCFSNISLFIKK